MIVNIKNRAVVENILIPGTPRKGGIGGKPAPSGRKRGRRTVAAAFALAFALVLAVPLRVLAEAPKAAAGGQEEVTLVRAAMCEGVRDLAPDTPAVVFSASLKKISCFTEFDPVPEKGYIYHRWFHRDTLSTTKKLFIKPPRWATVSSIQPRGTDKGPWRVEVTDASGAVYHILRFSITD